MISICLRIFISDNAYSNCNNILVSLKAFIVSISQIKKRTIMFILKTKKLDFCGLTKRSIIHISLMLIWSSWKQRKRVSTKHEKWSLLMTNVDNKNGNASVAKNRNESILSYVHFMHYLFMYVALIKNMKYKTTFE